MPQGFPTGLAPPWPPPPIPPRPSGGRGQAIPMRGPPPQSQPRNRDFANDPPRRSASPSSRRRRSNPESRSNPDSRNLAGSGSNSSTSQHTRDEVNLETKITVLFSQVNGTDDPNLIGNICRQAMSANFDDLQKLLTNFELFREDERRPTVLAAMNRHKVNAMLLDKFEAISRLQTWPQNTRSLSQFKSNYHSLALGVKATTNLFYSTNALITKLAEDRVIQLEDLDPFFAIIWNEVLFLHSLAELMGALMGRRKDLEIFSTLLQQWQKLEVLINALKITQRMEMAALRVQAGRGRSHDAHELEVYSKAQFSNIDQLETQLQNIADESFVFEDQRNQNPELKLTEKGRVISEVITQHLPGLLIIFAQSDLNDPNIDKCSQLAEETLKTAGFEIPLSPITTLRFQQLMKKIIKFGEQLAELTNSNPAHEPSNFPKRGTSFGSSKNSLGDSHKDDNIELLLAEARDYLTKLEESISECSIFNSGMEPEDIGNFHTMASNLRTNTDFALEALKNLRSSCRDASLGERDMTACRNLLSEIEDKIRISNSLKSQYERLTALQKNNQDNKSKIFLKQHTQSKVSHWPTPKNHPQNKKLPESKVQYNFLLYVSEILQWAASPYLNNSEN